MSFDQQDYESFLEQASVELSDLENWIKWQGENCPFAIPKEIQRYVDCTVVNLKEDIERYRMKLAGFDE